MNPSARAGQIWEHYDGPDRVRWYLCLGTVRVSDEYSGYDAYLLLFLDGTPPDGLYPSEGNLIERALFCLDSTYSKSPGSQYWERVA